LKTVNALAAKSATNPLAKFDNRIRIMSSKGVLYQAIGNISGKEDTLTQGPELDKTTVDSTSEKLVDRLVKEIKEGTYRFKPMRRVYMDKSGKNSVSEEQMRKLKE
jgi:retron-type reverse transcriptase